MFLIVDGSSILATCFFATLPKSYFEARSDRERAEALSKVIRLPSGQMAGGVYTMTRSLFSLIKRIGPNYLAVVWSSQSSFRQKAYPAYRPRVCAVPLELKRQVNLMKKLLAACGIPVFERAGFEALDIAGTLVQRFKDKTRTCLYTNDERFLQLASSGVDVRLPAKRAAAIFKGHQGAVRRMSRSGQAAVFNEEAVQRIYGVTPGQLVDLRALSGDRISCIPGVRGIGQKTAASLLRVFGSVEEIYNSLEPLSCENRLVLSKRHGLTTGFLKKLFWEPSMNCKMSGKQAAFISKKLSAACRDVPLTVDLNDLKLSFASGAAAALSEYGFRLKLPQLDADRQQVLFAEV